MLRQGPTPPRQRVHIVSIEIDRGGATTLCPGMTVAVVCRFKDSEGRPHDAEEVDLVVEGPSEVEEGPPVHESVGVYSYALVVEAGSYSFRVSSSGEFATAAECQLRVHPSNV